jgi:flagellar motor switch protein FliM
MRPFDGNALLEINPTLIFPILEMLLGGTGKTPAKVNREVTEIEQIILEGFFRVILNDLRAAWHQVAALQFSVESFETEPQLLQLFAPNEAVIAIAMEVRIGDSSGMLNICIPSIIVKMLRQKLDQQWSARRTEATEDEHLRLFRLIKQSQVTVDARLEGPTLRVGDLLQLEDGQVLALDFPVASRVDLLVNGKLKFQGEIVSTGRKRAFEISVPVLANE